MHLPVPLAILLLPLTIVSIQGRPITPPHACLPLAPRNLNSISHSSVLISADILRTRNRMVGSERGREGEKGGNLIHRLFPFDPRASRFVSEDDESGGFSWDDDTRLSLFFPLSFSSPHIHSFGPLRHARAIRGRRWACSRMREWKGNRHVI